MKIMLSRKNYNRVMHAIDTTAKVGEMLVTAFVLFFMFLGFPFLALLLAP